MNEKNPRIALFVPSFIGGGAERVMVTIANNFHRRGLDVELVVFSATGAYLSEVADGVRIVDLGVSRAIRGVASFARYLNNSKPDVVLVTMTHIALCAFFGRMISLSGRKTKLYVREAISPSFHDLRRSFATSVRLFLLRYMYKSVECVVSTTDEMTVELEERYTFRRLVTIGNPVVTERFRNRLTKNVDCQWPWQSNVPIVMSVGRLGDQKDFATLISAFAKVRVSMDARLAIFGEGEYRAQLESQVEELGLSDSVWLPGFVDNPFAYMAGANLYVLSSKTEGLPNALIQALCAGTPVVSTRCPTGPADLLEEGRYGQLIKVGDINSMAKAIESSLKDDASDDDRKNHFLLKFDENTICDQYLEAMFRD